MNFDDYLKKFTKLRTGVSHGHVKPHKPVMMLAILSLIENRKITSNRIDYSPHLLELFKTRNPRSIKICTLLDKTCRRIVEVPVDYRGFEIPDEFVIGYGLDYDERYRNLPFIGVMKP